MLVSARAQNKAAKNESCYDTAQTQTELNDCAGNDLVKADKDLNITYQRILKKYAKDALFVKRLKEAQRAWLAFRDAQIQMKFPTSSAAESTVQYGTVYPMCSASYKAELTEQRTKQLREWLTGIEEGDVCAGSVKTPEDLKQSSVNR